MITDTGMRDLAVGQKIISGPTTGVIWVVKAVENDHFVIARDVQSPGIAFAISAATLAKDHSLCVPDERISEGLYRHRDGGPDDVYWVHSVGVMDEDGHGNPEAPRQVCYSGTRLVSATGVPLRNHRSEVEFGQLVRGWPDGIIRPRFVRLKYNPKS